MSQAIRVGSRVSGLVGPLQDEIKEGAKRKKRERFYGLVIDSKPGQKWLVYWFNICKCSIHSPKVLRVEKDVSHEPMECMMGIDVEQFVEKYYCSDPAKAVVRVSPRTSKTVDHPIAFMVGDINHPHDSDGYPIDCGIDDDSATTEGLCTVRLYQSSDSNATEKTAESTNPSNSKDPSNSITMNCAESDSDSVISLPQVINQTEPDADPDAEELDEVFYKEDEELQLEEEDLDATALRRHQRMGIDKVYLLGEKVTVKSTAGPTLTWKVINEESLSEERVELPDEFQTVGVFGFDFQHHPIRYGKRNCKTRGNYLKLLLHLWPGDWRTQLKQLNVMVRNDNKLKRKSNKREYQPPISENEFWIWWGLLLVARVHGRIGKIWDTVDPAGVDFRVDYAQYMPQHRFQFIRHYMSYVFCDPKAKGEDDWWQVIGGINAFNENRKRTVCSSALKVLDESMSAFKPRTTKTGNLPHLSYIFRKPEPLGTEFKVTACAETRILLHLELQRGSKAMGCYKYQNEYKATAACVLRMSEETERRRNKSDINQEHFDVPKQTWLGDSWFTSVGAVTAMAKAGRHYIGVLKTSHSSYPKSWIMEKMKDYPAGSHLVLETKNDGVDLLAIGYKYNKRKVLCFLATKGAGHMGAGTPYVQRWKDDNNNTQTRYIARPEIIAKYFEHCNVIDAHNQSRQFDLKLEKHWVTNCGFFRIVTSIFGMCVTDAWKALKLHERPSQDDLTIRDFTSMLAKDCLNNDFNSSLVAHGFSIGVQRIPTPEQLRNTLTSSNSNSPMEETSMVSALTNPVFGLQQQQQQRTPVSNLRSELQALCERHTLVPCDEEVFENKKFKGANGEVITKRKARKARGVCRNCRNETKTLWYCPVCTRENDCLSAKKAWYCSVSSNPICHRAHLKRVENKFLERCGLHSL